MDYPIAPIHAVQDEGRAAFFAGLPRDACPYTDGTEHALAWGAGFANGFRVYAARRQPNIDVVFA